MQAAFRQLNAADKHAREKLNISKRTDTFDVNPDDVDYMRHLDETRRMLQKK